MIAAVWVSERSTPPQAKYQTVSSTWTEVGASRSRTLTRRPSGASRCTVPQPAAARRSSPAAKDFARPFTPPIVPPAEAGPLLVKDGLGFLGDIELRLADLRELDQDLERAQ